MPVPVFKTRCLGFLMEMGKAGEAELFVHPAKVGLHLWARRQVPGPSGIAGKAVGVVMGGHIAGQPRIGIFTPGAPDLLCLFVDDKVVDTRRLQFDAREDACHPRTDDNDLVLGPVIPLKRHTPVPTQAIMNTHPIATFAPQSLGRDRKPEPIDDRGKASIKNAM